jgi:hypothetical protein
MNPVTTFPIVLICGWSIGLEICWRIPYAAGQPHEPYLGTLDKKAISKQGYRI